jgi:GntR family transcriptional regulator
MTTTEAARYLGEPLLTSPGQPLRVAVYSRISQGIRSGTLLSGALLPRETELGVALGVSRTVVREALMLLEEDGLIVTKRGVGRFVSDALPHEGPDGFQPLESLLAEPGVTLTVDRLEFTLQETTDFVSDYLGTGVGAQFWFRECLVSRDGQPVALVQEYVPDERRLSALDDEIGSRLRDAAEQPSTLLKAFGQVGRKPFTAGVTRIAATVAGRTRAAHLGIKASDPLLMLTQSAELAGVPAYVSKCALPPAFGHLAVTLGKP